MSKLSDILEAALPRTSSPAGSRGSRTHTPISRGRSPRAPLQSSRKGNVTNGGNVLSYGDLAREFGVDANVVEALAQRLSTNCS